MVGANGGRGGGAIHRWIALVLLLTVALGVLGGWLGVRRDRLHAATTTVLLTPLEGNPFSPEARDGLVNLETEAQLVTSDEVARAVARELGLPGEDAVVRGVSVQVPSNTQLVRIRVQRADPVAARDVADALARTYLAQRRARTEATVESRRNHVRRELRSMESELAALSRKRAGAGLSAQMRAQVDQQISALVAQMAQVQAEQTTLGYISEDPGQVVTPAAEDPRGPLPAPVLGTVLGVGLGVALGLGLYRVRLRRRDTVGSRIDLVAQGYPVVASADQVDLLRASVVVGLPHRPVVVVVADVGEHATSAPVMTRALATALGRARVSTLSVSLCGAVGAHGSDEVGVAEVVAGADLDAALVTLDDSTQHLPAGQPTLEGPMDDLVATPEFAGLLKDLRGRAEVVLVSGVWLPGPAGRILAGLADAVLVVATSGVSTSADLTESVSVARSGPGELLGIVHAGQRR